MQQHLDDYHYCYAYNYETLLKIPWAAVIDACCELLAWELVAVSKYGL